MTYRYVHLQSDIYHYHQILFWLIRAFGYSRNGCNNNNEKVKSIYYNNNIQQIDEFREPFYHNRRGLNIIIIDNT